MSAGAAFPAARPRRLRQIKPRTQQVFTAQYPVPQHLNYQRQLHELWLWRGFQRQPIPRRSALT